MRIDATSNRPLVPDEQERLDWWPTRAAVAIVAAAPGAKETLVL